jgi:hypothetical protein
MLKKLYFLNVMVCGTNLELTTYDEKTSLGIVYLLEFRIPYAVLLNKLTNIACSMLAYRKYLIHI